MQQVSLLFPSVPQQSTLELPCHQALISNTLIYLVKNGLTHTCSTVRAYE